MSGSTNFGAYIGYLIYCTPEDKPSDKSSISFRILGEDFNPITPVNDLASTNTASPVVRILCFNSHNFIFSGRHHNFHRQESSADSPRHWNGLSGDLNFPTLYLSQKSRMAALTKPSDIATKALVDWQQGTNVPSIVIYIASQPRRLNKSSQTWC